MMTKLNQEVSSLIPCITDEHTFWVIINDDIMINIVPTLSFSFFFLLISFFLSESLASFSAITSLVSGPGTWKIVQILY